MKVLKKGCREFRKINAFIMSNIVFDNIQMHILMYNKFVPENNFIQNQLDLDIDGMRGREGKTGVSLDTALLLVFSCHFRDTALGAVLQKRQKGF